MKIRGTLLLLLLASSVSVARPDEALEKLIARADTAPVAQQADLCMQVAERELKLTIENYKENKGDEGRASLDQVVQYADKAHSAAIRSGKKIKHTEIKLRQIAGHLRDLKYNANADDQPIVQAAIDKLEGFRTELLKSMFGPEKND